MLLSAITLSAATASLVPLPFLNPYCSSPKQLSVSALVCNLFVIILSSIFDAWVRRLIVRWSSQFIAFGFFCIGITMVWRKSSGHTPVLYLSLIYTSDAADERSSVDLGGRRII